MTTTNIKGIEVNFPFEPYACQSAYMAMVIEALEREENAALESPTGTGKTLSLLCASLAWLKNYKIRIGSTEAEQLALTAGLKDKGTRIAPQIIYASRTHSQLAQVVRELNKTKYKTFNVTTIASRDQLCINEQVAKEQDNKIKAHMCRALAGAHKCHFFNKWEKDSNITDELYKQDGKALDIEDLVSKGREYGHCPFFQSRSQKDNADLILLPYNYILDPRLRNSHKIQLKGNIVIFDEAHNLESVCEESSSVGFTSTNLAHCISEAQLVLQAVIEEIEALREQKDNTTEAFGAQPKKNVEDELNPNEIGLLISLLQKIESEIDILNLEQTKKDKKLEIGGKLFEGGEMMNLLERAGYRPDMREPISLLIDRMGQFLSKRAESQSAVFGKTGKCLQEFASFVATVSADSYENVQLNPDGTIVPCKKGEHTKNFYLYAEKEADSDKRTLNYWCFSAGVGMRFLQSRGVRSIIITSGTLSPLNHFISTMGIPFGITLENDHVAKADQICAASLNTSLNMTSLNGSFINRGKIQYKEGVGTIVLKTVQVVPQGVLVFFPSYTQMSDLLSCWKTPNKKFGSSLYEKIVEAKKPFVEPKSKAELKAMFLEYDQEIRVNKGAVMFAVCRGKVSEGIDFADTHCRAVIIVGIPYPPIKDTRVILKKHYLEEALGVRKEDCVTPDRWYKTEGIRAVNQAIGRIIRHKDDFGAVILADPRFSAMNKNDYPSWMRSSIKEYDRPMDFFSIMDRFFRDRGLACENSLRRLRDDYETSLRREKEKAEGLVTCRKRKLAQTSLASDAEVNKRVANELKGLYENGVTDSQADVVGSAIQYLSKKSESKLTLNEDFEAGSDSSAVADFFKSIQPRESSASCKPAATKRTIKLKSNSRVCDVNSSPSTSTLNLQRFRSQPASLTEIVPSTPSTNPSTSSASLQGTPQNENQNPSKTPSSEMDILVSKMPRYDAAEYSRMLKVIPRDIRKQFVDLQMGYTQTSNLAKLLSESWKLLRDYPDVFKGVFGFVRPAHQRSFVRFCLQENML